MDTELLRERAFIIQKVRAFFDQRFYLETDTPLMAPDLIPETCLEVFETSWIPPRGSRQREEKYWLVPSPEIWMKQLIARHRVNMYQICKCFRNTESQGHLHNPEFTMLEYYTMDADYLDSLTLTENLFTCLLAHAAILPTAIVPTAATVPTALQPPFLRITMEEAFQRWAGFSLAETAAAGPAAMEAEARRLGLDPRLSSKEEPWLSSKEEPWLSSKEEPWLSSKEESRLSSDTATLYDLIFIHVVEPSLPKDKPVAIIDYPAFVPCLARKKTMVLQTQGNAPAAQNPECFERWELYVNGIELANCYSEETNPEEIRRYFEAEAAEKKQNALVQHRINQDYWKFFLPDFAGRAFPRCSGVAMGLDRLIMAITGKKAITGVLPFA
ncbi:elongation factor P--(R)-beta-lysine ligase [Spirochaetia bacterium]|nr:elongation factor P--(R)-beta-lysine ligase [Spirochaetia bacterium]